MSIGPSFCLKFLLLFFIFLYLIKNYTIELKAKLRIKLSILSLLFFKETVENKLNSHIKSANWEQVMGHFIINQVQRNTKPQARVTCAFYLFALVLSLYLMCIYLHLVLLNSPAVTILLKQPHISSHFKPQQDPTGRVDEMPRGAHHTCLSQLETVPV